MSKINAVRLINLNYNNNSIRVSDETFQLGGESTLLSLRNGGGKSVLVQMLTAPFVHKQYRKTKDRPFESYFTTARPTFILVEWKLDQGAGYCLMGMMVRRNQQLEEQSQEALEIVNFISEYPARCEHDIYHIPLVEKVKNEIVLKNYHTCRQMFEAYKKDPSKKFFYYDMNNYAQSRQYFDKLAEYKIYCKEWETIIRKVNLKESGLSELFSDCKNEKELIEKWFVEAIENKLNHDQNRMKEFQTIVEKYVRMYKDNKSKIERRDTILKFKEDMQETEERAAAYLEAEQSVKASENRIACFLQKLKQLEEAVEKEQQKLEEKSQGCEKEIAHILYEKLSMEVHQLVDDLRFRSTNRDMIRLEWDDLEKEISRIEKILQLYDCAKQQQLVDEQKEEYELLTQRIKVAQQKEEELEPQRREIGGYLKGYYEQKLEESRNLWEQKKEECAKKEEQISEQKEREKEYQKQLEKLLVDLTAFRTRIEGFNRVEDEFNRNYRESFSRNIMGEYEPGMLEIRKKEYEKQLTELTRSCNLHSRTQEEIQEKKKADERNKEDKQNEKRQMEARLQILQDKEEGFEQQIRERQMIMRYLEAEDSLLWEEDKLMKILEQKLSQIELGRRMMEQEEDEMKKEWKNLTSGELLELPQDFSDLLLELELHPIYGMNWLEKNGYSMEENIRLIRRQPFLPYSLILPGSEIKKLETHGREIYTSYPIPLIPREALESSLVEEEGSVLNLSGISFYLWFNERLLDEEALRLLILEKEGEIKKKQEQIGLRRREYQDYTEKRSILNRQTLSKAVLEKNRKEQEELQEKIDQAEKEIDELKEGLIGHSKTLETLMQTILEEKQKIEYQRRRETDFACFCAAYKEYQENRQNAERCDQEKERYQEKKKQAAALGEKYTEELKSLELGKQQLEEKVSQQKDRLLKYEAYGLPTENFADTTPEELEARYEAITTGMSLELQELEGLHEKAGKSLERRRAEPQKKQEKYRLKEEEWKQLPYNEKEQLHQEVLLEDRQKKARGKELLWNAEDKQIAVLDSRIREKKKGISDRCGQEEPLAKEEIHTVDFDARINQLEYQLKQLREEEKIVDSRHQSLNENLAAFSEYEDFVISEAVVWQEDFSRMDAMALRNFSGILRRDHRHDTERLKQRKDKLEAYLNTLTRKQSYQEDYYRKPLEAMLAVTGQASLVLAQLQTTIQSYDSQMAKLAVDIALVEKEKKKIEGLLEDYVRDVHQNMSRIDNNSTITIREKPIKMLRLQLPDWEENEGVYRQRLEDYMEELTRRGIEIYEQNENAENYFSSRITTKGLYDTIVGIGNIQIKLYKIEEQREYPITWAEVARNSGGEGFLSAFVILSSLLHYMRRDETDIFADRNEGKVLVMDNPFAQTNAAHLLKPLMDMAKKTNTQLICLSGLGGDSIYSRFDNIYVLNLVAASLRGGMQYLRSEHTRGNEEEIMVASQIEVVEQQSLLF